MKFSNLPAHIQQDIARRIRDVEDDLSRLSEDDRSYLDSCNPEYLFMLWCEWQGFLGWSATIHAAHVAIFGGEK